ncbi:hypothetical protein ES703_85893 [subsurface metagenome]
MAVANTMNSLCLREKFMILEIIDLDYSDKVMFMD